MIEQLPSGNLKWLFGGKVIAVDGGSVNLDPPSIATVDLGSFLQKVEVTRDRRRVMWWLSAQPNEETTAKPVRYSWSWSLWELGVQGLQKLEQRTVASTYRAQAARIAGDGCFAAFLPERAAGAKMSVLELPCNGITSSVVHAIQLEGPPKRGGAYVEDLAFNPDGRFLVIAGPLIGAHVLDLQAIHGENRTRVLPGHERELADGMGGKERIQSSSSAAFSPDGRWLATGDATSVLIWSMQPAPQFDAPVRRLSTEQRAAENLEFSADGRFLKSGRQEILLWDLTSKIPQPSVLRPATTESLAQVSRFTPDGRSLVRVTLEDPETITAEIWPLTLPDMRALAKRKQPSR